MTIYVPWGLIAIFIALYTFYSYNRKMRLRREEKKEELNNRLQDLLNQINRAKNKMNNAGNPVIDNTSDKE